MRKLRGSRTLKCASTVLNNRRVKWSSGQLVHCGANDVAIGITDGTPRIRQDGTYEVPIISPKTEDGVTITASGSIGVGVAVYGAAAGMVSTTSTGIPVGTNWAPNVTDGGATDVQLAAATEVQQSAYTQTYATASKTVPAATQAAVATTAATSTTPFGYAGATQADAIPVAINAAAADILALKKVVNALIDDLQALGIVG